MYDGQGSTRFLTDDGGQRVGDYRYDAFGKARGFDPTASTTATRMLYTGEQFDGGDTVAGGGTTDIGLS